MTPIRPLFHSVVNFLLKESEIPETINPLCADFGWVSHKIDQPRVNWCARDACKATFVKNREKKRDEGL